MILKLNQKVVLVDKPAGWLSVPSRLGAQDSRPILGIQLQKELGVQIFPVHRLDVEVSGLMLYALAPDTHRVLSQAFEQHLVRKTYSALSEGVAPEHDSFVWESFLLRGKKRTYESPVGKRSVTEAKFLGLSVKGYLRWHLSPLTGRAHQLRYEMHRHHQPILGDSLYGSKVVWRPQEIALRSVLLKFPLTIASKIGLNEEESVSDLSEK
jgi:23S rRNA-/tRNA-specific pseudouridylate synthase